MSHFSVIVATADQPDEDVLERELQPFHEFECTGTDDQYVQEIDETEEIRAEYEKATTSRYRETATGALHKTYDDRFYRDPTEEETKQHGSMFGSGAGGGISWSSRDWGDGRGYRPKVHFQPKGFEEIELPRREVESFADFVQGYHGKEPVAFGEKPDLSGPHKCGYALLDANGDVLKIIDRTNPNSKWDYWRIGGRYTGKLQGRGGSQAPASYEWGMTEQKRPEGLDICQKCNLDVALMKGRAVSDRQEWVRKCCSESQLDFETFERACRELRTGHADWLKLPEPRPRGRDYASWLADTGRHLGSVVRGKCWEVPEPADGQSLAEWIQAAPWLTGFAFLREGKWAEKGQMGWWACVSNENEDWPRDFQKLIEDVPGEWWLTVVDCHC